jgi:hypothetical protein
MGVSGLKHKKIRLVFTILLSFIAFAMFGLSQTASIFESGRTELKSLYNKGVKTIMISSARSQRWGDRKYRWFSKDGRLTEDNIETIKSLTGKSPLTIVNNGIYDLTPASGSISLTMNFSNYNRNKSFCYYTTEIRHLLEIPTAVADRPLLAPLVGELPQNHNEIALTDYIADSFVEYGYKDGDNEKIVTGYADLIGETIASPIYGALTITGVFSTEYDKRIYNSYKNIERSDNWSLEEVIVSGIGNTIMGMGLVGEGFTAYHTDRILRNWINTGETENEGLVSTFRHSVGMFTSAVTDNIFKEYSHFSLFDGNSPDIYWRNGSTRDNLNQDEIIISVDAFDVFGNQCTEEEIMTLTKSEIKILEEERIKLLFDSLSDTDLICLFGRMYYLMDKDGNAITETEDTTEMKIVGIVFNDSACIINETFYETFYAKYLQAALAPMAVLAELSGNMEKDLELFHIIGDSLVESPYRWDPELMIGFKMRYYTSATEVLDALNSILEIFKGIFIWVSFIFSLFAGMLMMNFIGVSVAFKRKEIGILRAIGARSADIFGIFFNESLVIGTINMLLASIALILTSVIFNNTAGIAILVPGVVQFLLMAVLCYGVAFTVTYFAVRNVAHRKPIDAINNR